MKTMIHITTTDECKNDANAMRIVIGISWKRDRQSVNQERLSL